MPKVHITDVILRDAHQSLIATRMRTEDMLPICERLDKIGFWSLEFWGGATFDVCLRFLRENPWERLRMIKAKAKNFRNRIMGASSFFQLISFDSLHFNSKDPLCQRAKCS